MSSAGSAGHQNRYSFYADPRYHDYHRSTQGSNYATTDYSTSTGSTTRPVQHSPYINRIDNYSSLPKRAEKHQSAIYDDYQVIPSSKSYQPISSHHQRYKSYDSTTHSNNNTSQQRNASDPLQDYDDPMYAQIRKTPHSNNNSRNVSKPAQV